ncbi:uncharacterized protein LOC143289151 [Babylonia areolata]|uniref:uncharacterized protein LOC143289151 n=1 Tax=Babylonia areolata TaxID=304850 RepID=UPI003FD14148
MLTPAALMLCVAVMTAGAQVVRSGEEDIPTCPAFSSTYIRSSRQCPVRAVCADVWNTVRDWQNGTRCREHRVMLNCRCPRNGQCPIGNPAHALHGSVKHSQYMCEPACILEACRTRTRPAKELVSNTRSRGYRYYRINCRCAGHHYPRTTRNPRRGRATTYMRLFFERRNRLLLTQFKCARLLRTDPCPPSQE